MKKNYFMLVCLVLLMAVSAKAQINSVVDLFGKYRFTADVEFTAAGEAYKDILSADCDANIEADETYSARIIGFAGSQVKQNVQGVDGNNINIINPNNPTLWDNGLLLANENGDHPYGVFEDGEWKVEMYNSAVYTYDLTTKVISVPDFTVVKLENGAPVLVAKYTNVKMTLTESVEVEVADISGEWNFKAGSSTYSTMEGSVIPTEFPVTLEKSADNNMTYNATFTIEGYEPVVLPATFDGNSLAIEYDSTYLDAANGVRFGTMNGSKVKKGSIEFKNQSETSFSLYSGFSFVVDSIGKNKAGDADSVFVKLQQWYMDGTLKSKAAAPAMDWSGVYNVSLKNAEQDLYIKDAAGFEWPTEFQFEVTYYEAIEKYFITKIFGLDVVNLNNGGLPFVPAEDGKSVEISTGLLYTVESQVKYLALRDMNMSANAIKMDVNEDGSMSVTGLSIATVTYGENAGQSLNAFYTNLVVAKAGAEPEAPVFNWVGDYKLSAGTVEVYYQGDVAFPAEFDVTIEYFDGSEYGMDSFYYISKFMGKDIPQTPIDLNIAEDGNSADMLVGCLCGAIVPGELYYKIYDMNATADPVKMTVNANGTVSIANFFIKVLDYNTNEETAGAFYKNVVLAAPGAEPETPVFEWTGDYKFTAGAVDVYYQGDVAFPAEFDVTIEYFDGSEYGMDSFYYISKFLGKDIPQTPIDLNIAEDGNSADMLVGCLCGAIVPGELYYKIYDMNATTDPVKMTVNEDGTVSIANFFIKVLDYNTNEESAGAFYKNVTLQVAGDSSAIEDVVVEDAVVEGIFDMQGRRVSEIVAPGLYIVNGKKVLVK